MNHPFAPNCWKSARAAGMALSILLAFITLIPFPLKSQQSPPQEVSTRSVEPTFKLQAERNMVTVRVVVRNGKGETVDNLRQEDFQLFDRGKKQTITHFSVEKAGPVMVETSAPKPSPPEPGVPKRTPPVFTLPSRFVALYFDDVSTGFSGLARSRDAADRFLKSSLHSGDRVGVFTSSGQKPQDFTDDLAKVRQALATLTPHPLISRDESICEVTPYEAYYIVTFRPLSGDPIENLIEHELENCEGPNINDPNIGNRIRQNAQRIHAQTVMKSTVTLRGLEALVRLMSTVPGQRSIVFVSDGFQSQTLGDIVSQISDRALRANIVINALDARGLYVDASVDASQARPTESNYPEDLVEKEQVMREEALQATEAMGTLAQDTGGKLFENNNDLEAGFRRLAAAPDTSYTLAFSPENLKHDGAFHGLKVTLVSGKGLNVQARKGYYAPKKSEDLAAQEKEDLQDAVFSQNEMKGLPIEVNTQFFAIDKTNAEIDVVTHVDLAQVHFRKEADRNLGTLTFVTGVFDRDGHYVAGQQKVLEMHLRDASLERFLRTGIKVQTELKVSPGIYLIRAVVRDSDSGQISAVSRTVEIPY
ncbi:MAG: VWA domain-containing protein [Acidobacteriota bacterium]|nr:VWA domain-containing protein [Acidobacteriota bacterium]